MFRAAVLYAIDLTLLNTTVEIDSNLWYTDILFTVGDDDASCPKCVPHPPFRISAYLLYGITIKMDGLIFHRLLKSGIRESR